MNFIKNNPWLVLAIAALSCVSVAGSSLISTLTKWNSLELASFEKDKMSHEEFELVAKENLLQALSYFPYYTDNADEEKIVKAVLKRDLVGFLSHIEKYKDTEYISEVIDSIPLEELLLQHEHIPKNKLFESINSLFEWLHSIKIIKIAQKNLVLDLWQHDNIYSWLLKTYLANKKAYLNPDKSIHRDKVKVKYEENIKKFIEQGQEWAESKENTHTFWVRVSHRAWDDKNNGFAYGNEKLKKIYKENFTWEWKFHDYSSEINPQSADHILNAFEQNIKKYPRDNHIFHLWAHGKDNGSGLLKWWNRTKEHFDRLLNIQTKYPENIKIDIGSCRSRHKDTNFYNNRIKNLSMDSGQYRSYWWENWSDATFLEAFEAKDTYWNFVADIDGDRIVNFNEALFYRNINYNKSPTPTMFDDGTGGKAVDISMNDGVYRDASLYNW